MTPEPSTPTSPRFHHPHHFLAVHLSPGFLDDALGQRRVADGGERVHKRFVRHLLQQRLGVFALTLHNHRLSLRHRGRLRENLRRHGVGSLGVTTTHNTTLALSENL